MAYELRREDLEPLLLGAALSDGSLNPAIGKRPVTVIADVVVVRTFVAFRSVSVRRERRRTSALSRTGMDGKGHTV